MELRWTNEAIRDVERLRRFLATANQRAAQQVAKMLRAAPARLLEQPRIGIRLEEFKAREVRRLFVGSYELRYEIVAETIYILRIWHGREDR